MQTIELTDEVRQDATKPPEDGNSAGFMVFDNNGGHEYFDEYRDAEWFAQRKMDDSPEGIASWTIYPLYAAKGIEIEC